MRRLADQKCRTGVEMAEVCQEFMEAVQSRCAIHIEGLTVAATKTLFRYVLKPKGNPKPARTGTAPQNRIMVRAAAAQYENACLPS
jgi:hypothetical protein